MYKYETHLHTYPVSLCAKAGVRETLEFYKEEGYDGVFITNHFLDGNINISRSASYEDKINFYFSDYEEGLKIGGEIGIKVFLGIEMSYGGTDFLVYGLDKAWFLENPQIIDMDIKEKLSYIGDNGGYIVHAHPFRESRYIDHIRLYPSLINAVEVINANRRERENKMAELFAENYGLPKTAGSDNHTGRKQSVFAGVKSKAAINSEAEYIRLLKDSKLNVFMCSK